MEKKEKTIGSPDTNNRDPKRRIAVEVENILAEYPKSREQFKKNIETFNLYFRKYWECVENKPVPYEDPKGENIKAGYEYDPDFKICFPIENAEIPNPSFWEIDDKLPCYYATLAVMYDLIKGKDAPFSLCTGVLDELAFGFVKKFIEINCNDNDRFDTAIKWVKNDLDDKKTGDGFSPGQDVELDDLNNKIIQLYQLAEQKNEKPPSAAKIAKVAYNTHITSKELSRQAINDRITKLRAAGLIGKPKNKEKIQSSEQICDNSESHKMKF